MVRWGGGGNFRKNNHRPHCSCVISWMTEYNRVTHLLHDTRVWYEFTHNCLITWQGLGGFIYLLSTRLNYRKIIQSLPFISIKFIKKDVNPQRLNEFLYINIDFFISLLKRYYVCLNVIKLFLHFSYYINPCLGETVFSFWKAMFIWLKGLFSLCSK